MYLNLPQKNIREAKLLEGAIDAFHAATGIRIQVEPHLHGQDRQTDTLVRLRIPNIDEVFAAEVKMRVTNATLGTVMHPSTLAGVHQTQVLITDYVNPLMADRLMQMNIPFIDTVGNAYLNVPPVFVLIKGNRPPAKLPKETISRAFQPTGLKIIFAFICHPDLVTAPYRDIAKTADVALGTVGRVITDLQELGYLVDMGKRGRRLVNRKELLDRWVTTYPERLRPKLLVGRFSTTQKDWWKDAPLVKFKAYWGGEVAAARITRYLRPEQITIYAREPTAELELTYRLRKAPEGNIELLRAFWDIEWHGAHREDAPPVLVYADLLATGDPRNIATAQLIYEQELTRLIGKD